MLVMKKESWKRLQGLGPSKWERWSSIYFDDKTEVEKVLGVREAQVLGLDMLSL